MRAVVRASEPLLCSGRRQDHRRDRKRGWTVLLGVEEGDTDEDANYMAGKITGLRIFEDSKVK